MPSRTLETTTTGQRGTSGDSRMSKRLKSQSISSGAPDSEDVRSRIEKEKKLFKKSKQENC